MNSLGDGACCCSRATASSRTSNRFTGSRRPTAPIASCPGSSPSSRRASATCAGLRQKWSGSMPFKSVVMRSAFTPEETRVVRITSETAITRGYQRSSQRSAGE